MFGDYGDCVIMFSPWSTWWWHWSFPPLCLGLMTIPILTRMDTNVYGSFINLKILHSSHSWQYSALQWRHLQICKAASITRCFFKDTCPGYLFNLANSMIMLSGDSRYNLALSLLKSDYCRQSYTASGPHVPMCPCAHHWPVASVQGVPGARVDVTIECDT